MIEILIGKIQRSFLVSFSQLGSRCLLKPEQRTLEDESAMIRNQMGSTRAHKMVALEWDASYDTTP
jgi:hypothetical protein